MEPMWVKVGAMKRRTLGERMSSRSCRLWLRLRFRRVWVLTIHFTYRSYTLSWTAQTRCWMILRLGYEMGHMTPNRLSACFLFILLVIAHNPTSLQGIRQ